MDPIETIVLPNTTCNYVIYAYDKLKILVIYFQDQYRTFIIVHPFNIKSLICNRLKPVFGLKYYNISKICLNSKTYTGYETTMNNYMFIKTATLSLNELNEIRKIHIFRYIIGATYNEDKITITMNREVVSFGESRFVTNKHYINEMITAKRFNDIDIREFVHTHMPEMCSDTLYINIEKIIKSLDPAQLIMLNMIMDNVGTLIY